MKSFVVVSCIALFLIGTCLAIDAVAADSEKPSDILIPGEKDLAILEVDQVPDETKHWWYGHKYDWDKKKHGEHDGGHWNEKYAKAWWWKWH